MAKQIEFDKNARSKLLVGINKIANAIKITAGPKGRNAILERKYGAPLIANDGVTIAKEIELPDRMENMGARLIAEAAIATNEIAGDGTTTATILAQEMVNSANKFINTGANPINIRKGMETASKEVMKYLVSISKSISTTDEITQVGVISSGSKEIGQKIAKAMEKVGKDGVITIDDGKTLETTFEVTEGLEFKGGYSSPYMVTDNEKMIATFDNPFVMVSSKKVNTMKEILSLLENVMDSGNALVMVATDFSDEVVTNLAINKLRGTINVVTVKCAEFGDKQKSLLEDLAVATGTKMVDDAIGVDFKNITISDLGKAQKITITKDKTTIVKGNGDKSVLASHVKNLKAQLASANDEYSKELISQRIARLSNGVAVIKVGGATEVEQKERKLRIEDALNSTKAAVEEGIVPGGGIALLNAIAAISSLKSSDKDTNIGYEIVRSALVAPASQIIKNAGYNPIKALKDIETQGNAIGMNAETGKYVNMVREGIIDPTKVVKTALEKATSIAALLITTEVGVVDIKDDKTSTGSSSEFMGGGL